MAERGLLRACVEALQSCQHRDVAELRPCAKMQAGDERPGPVGAEQDAPPIMVHMIMVGMPIITPGIRMVAIIMSWSVVRSRPETELIRIAAAVPTITAMMTTAKATRSLLRKACSMRSSAQRSMYQRQVNPFRSTIEGGLLSLKAAPTSPPRARSGRKGTVARKDARDPV